MNALIVDDHTLFHDTLSAILRKAFVDVSVHCESDLAGALSWARGCGELDLALLDLGLPDSAGLATLKQFRRQFPRVRVVVVSSEEDRGHMREAIRSGAAGYIPKISRPAVIIEALRLVYAGGIYVPPEALENFGRDDARPSRRAPAARLDLTARQAGVLRLVLKGHTNRQIADALHIAEATVKQHVHAVYSVLGVSTRAEALVAAARLGIRLD